MVGRALSVVFRGEHFLFCPLFVSLSCRLSCPCHLSLSCPANWGQNRIELPVLPLSPATAISQLTIFLVFFPRPCRQSAPPAESPFLFGLLRLFFLVCCLAHLHDCIRLSVLHAPPPCPMFPNASICFFAILHLKVPLLGSAGGSKPCFWASPVLTFEGTTPLSSPSYPSLTHPPP